MCIRDSLFCLLDQLTGIYVLVQYLLVHRYHLPRLSITSVIQNYVCDCYPAFYLVLNHATFKQIKKRHNINYSDGFYIGLLYAVPLVLS